MLAEILYVYILYIRTDWYVQRRCCQKFQGIGYD